MGAQSPKIFTPLMLGVQGGSMLTEKNIVKIIWQYGKKRGNYIFTASVWEAVTTVVHL